MCEVLLNVIVFFCNCLKHLDVFIIYQGCIITFLSDFRHSCHILIDKMINDGIPNMPLLSVHFPTTGFDQASCGLQLPDPSHDKLGHHRRDAGPSLLGLRACFCFLPSACAHFPARLSTHVHTLGAASGRSGSDWIRGVPLTRVTRVAQTVNTKERFPQTPADSSTASERRAAVTCDNSPHSRD